MHGGKYVGRREKKKGGKRQIDRRVENRKEKVFEEILEKGTREGKIDRRVLNKMVFGGRGRKKNGNDEEKKRLGGVNDIEKGCMN